MLASDSDNESEYDSDSSSSESGPFKQVWGNSQLKGTTTKYDFSTAPPEDGEQFLLAVRNERNKIPSCVSADMSKIGEIKKRSTVNPTPSKDSLMQLTGESETTEASQEGKPGSEIADQMERLKLQEPGAKNKIVSQTGEDVGDLARFLPTPAWRANRVSQFKYIRIKMDLTRDMMLQGKVYVVPSFTKFERDRIYWLRYCLGILDAAKMIEIKRTRKVRAKEIYDATKQLELSSSTKVSEQLEICKKGEDDSENDSDDSDVHIVSKEDVVELQSIDSSCHDGEYLNVHKEVPKDDDLMKISGSSMDELVVVHTSGAEELESLQQNDQSDALLAGSEGSIVDPNVETSNFASGTSEMIDSESHRKNLTMPSEASVAVGLSSGSDFKDASQDLPMSSLVPPEEGSKKEPFTNEVVQGIQGDKITEDDFVDPAGEFKKLHGHQPSANLLISMPQRLLEYLLTLQLDWLKEFGLINRKQGNWLFALFSSLQVPFEPNVISDLRQIALQCVKIRYKTKECMQWSLGPGCCEEASVFSPVYESISHEDFGPDDVISSCNLFIGIVVDYFFQKDLNKYLTLDGKDEF